jgi:serine/threonine-protein kinase
MDDGEVVWGTPAYFAPEQAAGDRMMPTSDVYAIGIILYEMFTGTVPFVGDSDQDVARKQLYENPLPISHHTQRVPKVLEAAVHKALLKDPGQRFHSADELRQALVEFKQSRLQQSTTGHAPQSTIDWVAMVLGVVAIAAVLGLVPLWTRVYRSYFPQQQPPSLAPIPSSWMQADPLGSDPK